MEQWLKAEFLGNDVRQYLTAAGTFLAVMGAVLFWRGVLLGRLRARAARTATHFDDALVELLSQVGTAEFGLLALYLAARSLALPPGIFKILHVAVVAALSYRGIRVLQDLSTIAVAKAAFAEAAADGHRREGVRAVTFLVNGVIAAGGLLFALDNLGVNVSAMLAGLGVTGIAAALAAQSVLGDLFSAVAIHLDRPFTVGDFIVVDSYQGTVEHVGVKTTRVRSLSGELIVFPNSQLTSSKLRNFQHLRERRVVFNFFTVFQTPLPLARRIPELVTQAIVATEKARPERVHLKGIGEWGFEYEAVYHVLDPDYNRYMDANQRIHLAVLESFEREGVRLAYPTRAIVNQA